MEINRVGPFAAEGSQPMTQDRWTRAAPTPEIKVGATTGETPRSTFSMLTLVIEEPTGPVLDERAD
jgi:hypothetical protein